MPPLEAQIQLPQHLGVLGELLLTNLVFNIYSYLTMAEGGHWVLEENKKP